MAMEEEITYGLGGGGVGGLASRSYTHEMVPKISRLRPTPKKRIISKTPNQSLSTNVPDLPFQKGQSISWGTSGKSRIRGKTCRHS